MMLLSVVNERIRKNIARSIDRKCDDGLNYAFYGFHEYTRNSSNPHKSTLKQLVLFSYRK